MKRSRFSEEQIIGILREAEAGSPIKAVCAAHNISTGTYHAWKRKFGGMEVSEAERLRALEEENSRLKRLVTDQAGRFTYSRRSTQKSGEPVCKTTGRKAECGGRHWKSGSGLSGAGTREVKLLSQRPIEPGKPAHPQQLSAKDPRYGYRRITALMRREGFEVNGKRVARIRREEGIKVSKKQRRMKRLGMSTAERQRPERRGQVWSWDFVTDQTENGSSFRILTLLAKHTRQCLAIHPACLIRAVDVITVVEAAIARSGAPGHLRSDNGPEFIASCMQQRLKAQSIKTLYIKLGSPWENGPIESFHEAVVEWQNRPLERSYPVIYFDA